MKTLNHKKSLGPCSIPVKILKNYVNDLKQHLAFFINLSFQQGLFPEALKTARVTHIFKKDNPQIPSNYRPIVLDNDYFICGIFIDFQKAFDTLNHDILFAKLDHYGIRGLANSWLNSFLKNRT